MAGYPLCEGHYYGVDYGARGREGVPPGERPTEFVPPHCGGDCPDFRGAPAQRGGENGTVPFGALSYAPNDLSWYANIPVPTSYMCMGSQEDFLGGYDHFRQAGVIMYADHHIAPGKKQWTWGNHEFGYAWDRNLTDSDGPYIELMTGVFTDNQPDFSFLAPGETRTWRQYWYPIHQIGPAQRANLDAAVSLALGKERFRIGVCVTAPRPGAVVRLESPNGDTEWEADLAPGKPLVVESRQDLPVWKVGETTLRVLDANGQELIAYQAPPPRAAGDCPVPPPASEPPPPSEVASNDERLCHRAALSAVPSCHRVARRTEYWIETLRRGSGRQPR